MSEEEEIRNQIDMVPDLLEEILILLPLKSRIRCKIVSKQWRSILESNSFVERRKSLLKKKILGAYKCNCSGERQHLLHVSLYEREYEQVEIVYIHRNATTGQSSMIGFDDGFLCFPEKDLINLFNPSTGKVLRFPSRDDQFSPRGGRCEYDHYLGHWVYGFGKDRVSGSYKVVKMCGDIDDDDDDDDDVEGRCNVLDVKSGEWRKLIVPPNVSGVGRQSVCVNGSVFWLVFGLPYLGNSYNILALDLHKEEFHIVSVPPKWVTLETKIANLDGRLAIAKTIVRPQPILEICSMNADEEIWSKTYSIRLDSKYLQPSSFMWYMPLTVSEQGNLVFYNNHKWLFKYCPETDQICRMSPDNCVIPSPFDERLVVLESDAGQLPRDGRRDNEIRTSRCRLLSEPRYFSGFWKRSRFGILEIVFTCLVLVGYFKSIKSQASPGYQSF